MIRKSSQVAYGEFDHQGRRYAVISYPVTHPNLLLELTSAEIEVLEQWLDGASAKSIAKKRGSAVRTVNNQVAAIYRKLGVRSRAELATRLQSWFEAAS